jgi:hypothetical protein
MMSFPIGQLDGGKFCYSIDIVNTPDRRGWTVALWNFRHRRISDDRFESVNAAIPWWKFGGDGGLPVWLSGSAGSGAPLRAVWQGCVHEYATWSLCDGDPAYLLT